MKLGLLLCCLLPNISIYAQQVAQTKDIEKLLLSKLRYEVFDKSKLVIDTTNAYDYYNIVILDSILADPISTVDSLPLEQYHGEVFSKGQIELLVDHLSKLAAKKYKSVGLQNNSSFKTFFHFAISCNVVERKFVKDRFTTQIRYRFYLFFNTIKL